MKEVTVQKQALLDALQANKDAHRAEFLRAQEGWRNLVIEELDRRLADFRASRRVLASFNYPEPEDHTRDYLRIIRMVEMEVSPTITIPEADFARYVMDDWEWKANWTATNTRYVQR